MKKYIAAVFFLVFSMSIRAESENSADELVFIPSIALLVKQLNFEQTQSGIVSYKGEFSGLLPMLDLSFTTGTGDWFVTVKYDVSLSEASVDSKEPGRMTPSGSNQYFWQTPGSEMNIEREDKNITVGFRVMEGMNIFAGYMQGETTINVPPTCANPVVMAVGPTLVYCQTYNYAWLRLREHYTFAPSAPFDSYVQTYTEKGPYLGLSYAWNIVDAGVLSLSAAYAEMTGTFEDNMNLISVPDLDSEGDVSGYSVGLTWVQPLGEKSAYFIDLREQAYTMKAQSKIVPAQHFDTDETMTGLTLGMQFYY